MANGSKVSFKWLGSAVDCYYPNFSNKHKCVFYKSFTWNGQCFDVGDFTIVNSTKNEDLDRFAKLLCVYESTEESYSKTKYRGVVQWYIKAKDFDKKLIPKHISLNQENEVIEDGSAKKDHINLFHVKKKVRLVLATITDPVNLITRLNLNPKMYFLCRYRLVDSTLKMVLSSPSYDNENFLNCQVIDLDSDENCNPVTPPSKNTVKRNLNKTFESNSESETPQLNYSVVDLSSDSDTSVKIKLRVSQRHTKTDMNTTKSDGVRKSKRDVKRISYAELLSPEKYLNSPRKSPRGSSSVTKKLCDISDSFDTKVSLKDTGRRSSITNTPLRRSKRISSETTPKKYSLQTTPKKVRMLEPHLEEVSPKKSKLSVATPPKSPKTPKTPRTASRRSSVSRMKLIKEGVITPTMEKRDKVVKLSNTPLAKAQNRLHVSFVPEALPCRENEYTDVYNFVESKLYDGFGGCMYISGVPGTGKTATVTSVIRKLQKLSGEGKVPEFDYVEVNGMKLSEPRQSYVEILKQLTGKTATWEQAHNILETRFSKSKKSSPPVVLLVDELDMLCTKRQDVVYNLLEWPTKAMAKLIVITIANTMDLPERLLMNRVTSRLGLTRLTFQAYTHKQLQEIVTKRLFGTNSFNNEAVQLVARKVASVSGDARRALDICRRAAEIAEAENNNVKNAVVTIQHVNEALNAMITQPKIQAIKHCSKLQQLILQAIVAETERTGVEETTFEDMYRMLRSVSSLEGFEMVTITVALGAVSRLSACRLILADQKFSDIHQRLILNTSSDDVYYALKND